MKKVMTTVRTVTLLLTLLFPFVYAFIKARCIQLSEFQTAARVAGSVPFCPQEQPHDHRDQRFDGYVDKSFPGITAEAPPTFGIEMPPFFNGALVGGYHNYALGAVVSEPFCPPLLKQSTRLRQVFESRVVNARIGSVRILRRNGLGTRG